MLRGEQRAKRAAERMGLQRTLSHGTMPLARGLAPAEDVTTEAEVRTKVEAEVRAKVEAGFDGLRQFGDIFRRETALPFQRLLQLPHLQLRPGTQLPVNSETDKQKQQRQPGNSQ